MTHARRKAFDCFDPWVITVPEPPRCIDCGAVLASHNESKRCWACGEREFLRNPQAKPPWMRSWDRPRVRRKATETGSAQT